MENENQNQNIEQQNAPVKASWKQILFSKKVIIVAVIFVLILILITLFMFLTKKQMTNPTQKTTTSSVAKTFGSIVFSPSIVAGISNQMTTVDINVTTDNKPISGIVISIKYNPLIFRDVTLTQFTDTHSALSFALRKAGDIRTDTVNGTVTLSLTLPKGVPAFSGTGKVAELSFVTKSPRVALLDSQITFEPITALIQPNVGENNTLTKKALTVTLSE